METLSPPADLYDLWISSWAFDHYLLTICFSVISVTQPADLSEKVSGGSGFRRICVEEHAVQQRSFTGCIQSTKAEQNQARFISHTSDQFKDTLEKHQLRWIKEPLKFKYVAKKKLWNNIFKFSQRNCQHTRRLVTRGNKSSILHIEGELVHILRS